MQFREACYTVVSYAPYILLQIYTMTILATFRVTIFEIFHPGPQPILKENLFRSSTVTYMGTRPLNKEPRYVQHLGSRGESI